MRWPVCPYCGCPAIPTVGIHIAWTEECMHAQIDKVLFEGSESEGEEP